MMKKIYRKYRNKRTFNRIAYKITKIGTKILRDKASPVLFKKMKGFGVFGKTCGKVCYKLITPFISKLSYSATGVFYDKTKNTPQKGSLLYTLFYFLFVILILGIVSLIILIA